MGAVFEEVQRKQKEDAHGARGDDMMGSMFPAAPTGLVDVKPKAEAKPAALGGRRVPQLELA